MQGLEQVSPEELAMAGFIAQQGFDDGKDVAIRISYNLAANTWLG